MSEYQRIAFRAIDGQVSEENLEYMRRQSSRAEITRFRNCFLFSENGVLQNGIPAVPGCRLDVRPVSYSGPGMPGTVSTTPFNALTPEETTYPRLYTDLASSPRSTIHIGVLHELTSKSMFASRAIFFANSRSLQNGRPVTTPLGLSRAPTSVVRVRAQKNVRSRAGKYRTRLGRPAAEIGRRMA